MEPPEADLDPVANDVAMFDSTTLPLQSVGDQQQNLGAGPHTAPYRNLHLGICFSRPCQVGELTTVGSYCKTNHFQYQCLHKPQ